MAFSPSGQSAEELSGIAETLAGPFMTALSNAARKHRIRIVATLYEKSKTKRVYDTAILLDQSGKIASVYRKLHLYDALGFKESTKLMPGSKISRPVKARPWNLGLLICYDIRFPELSRMLAVDGADILVAPSAWVKGDMKEEHWQVMVKARAIENGAYVIAPDQVGNIYCGRSMAVDPFGVVLADMGQKEGLEVIELDPERVKQVRKSLPLLKNRRSDIYKL
jgi:predicted amidohydrolase